MTLSELPRLSDGPRKELYRFVERQGRVGTEVARVHLDMDHERFHEALGALKEADYVVEQEGELRLALEAGEETTHSADGMEFTVRPARHADFPGIVKVVRHVADEDGYVVADGVAAQLQYEDTVNRHSDARSRVFFVATDEESVIGWTHLETSPRAPERHTARQTVGVLEPYRGYRIGSVLLERGLEWAADNGRLKVYNSLPATNEDAMGFLEARGWETEAIRRDHYLIDGDLVDEVMMAVYPDGPR